MKNKYITFFSLLLLTSQFSFSQSYIKKKSGKDATFKQMQRDFNDWKKNNDLSQIKYWKHFKRWEMETQLHTNSSGEPAGHSEYIKAAVDFANQKEQTSSLKKMNSGNWYPVGPNHLTGSVQDGMGRINCIAFHPNDPNTYFVGVAQGGVWKTSDNGVSWTPLTDNLPILRISDISIDPSNPNTMYISVCDYEYIDYYLEVSGNKRQTHFGLGVYKTTDGGNSWSPTGLSFQLSNGEASLIRKIIVDPTNSSKLVACGVSGMYTSANGGTSWTRTHDSLFWDMQIDPSNTNILYASTGWTKNANHGSAAIYKSTNFGSTWTLLNTGIPLRDTVQAVRIAVSPSNSNYIYALAVDIYEGLYAIYKSTDSGNSWTAEFSGDPFAGGANLMEWGVGDNQGGQGNYDAAFMVNPTNENIIYVGGVNIWMSTDGAQSFDPVMNISTGSGQIIHCDIHFFSYQPLTHNFFVCSDGGIYRTPAMSAITLNDAQNGTQWPTAWTCITDGMQISSFYRVSSSKTTTGEILAGAQDNNSFYFDGTSWSTIFGGDGMDNWIDTTLPGNIIGSWQYGNFIGSSDGGMSWFQISANNNGENSEWTTPLTADYNSAGTLYTGFGNVNVSNDGGFSWSQISNFSFDPFYQNEISALAVSKTNPDVIYAARRVRYEYGIPGSLWMTPDGGSTWNDVTAGIPDSLYYTSVEVSSTNSGTAYITMAGFSNGNKIFKTTNGGLSWTNISYNLPNIPVNCVKSIPGTNDIMVATDIGIWKLDVTSTTWQNVSTGLPNVITTDIEFNPALNKIYISTFGRGMWATDLDVFAAIKNTNASTAGASFHLFPSVNNGSFTISGADNKNDMTIEIRDANGKVVMNQVMQAQSSYLIQYELPAGLYFAKIRNGNLFDVKRFVVEK